MKIDVDARGLGCPQPVIRTKQALDAIEEGTINVLIERPEGRENVERYARSQGHTVEVTEQDGLFTLSIHKGKTAAAAAPQAAGRVVLITGDTFGTGDEELGSVLMRAFITTIVQSGQKPARMLFVNRGIMLTTEGSPVLDDLRSLEDNGTEIFSCGTCLDYYKLKEKLVVGRITNMYDTVNSLFTAENMIRI